MRSAYVFLALATVFTGCGQKTPESGNVSLEGRQVSVERSLTGTVVEAIPASAYLYLRLKTSKGEVWAAVDGGAAQAGSEVTVANGMLMKDFKSTTLDRTFSEIYFGTLVPSGGSAIAPGTANPHAGAAPSVGRVNVNTVDRATGGDARTVAETWAQRVKLEGKTVTLRGVVVKVNEGVMGKNWIHLQDGSGDVSQGNFDMTVTTLDAATAGDTITVTGTVRTNRDVGAGYVYAVLVEDAKVVKK